MIDLDTERKVTAFLYREARLMDENRYAEWLDLFDDEVLYWIPQNEYDYDPNKHASILYCDRGMLGRHVKRLIDGKVFTQIPKSRLRRTVSNVEVSSEGKELAAACNFVIVEFRNHIQTVHGGRSEYSLIDRDGEFKIRRKTVLLAAVDEPQDSVTFLL